MKENDSNSALKIKHYPKFHVSLFTIIIIILSISSICMTWAVFSISRDVSTKKAEQLFMEAGKRVEQEFNSQLKQALRLSRQISTLPGLAKIVPDMVSEYIGYPLMIETLKIYPNLYSIFVGLKDSQFFQIIHTSGDSRIITNNKAPDTTEFIVRSISLTGNKKYPYKETWMFLDVNQKYLGERETFKPKYDPVTRPWYQNALAANKVAVLTKPYNFYSLQEPGITASRAGNDGFVVGVDITLSNLSTFLNNLNVSDGAGLLLLDEDNQILATNSQLESILKIGIPPLSKIEEVKSPLVSELRNTEVKGLSRIWRDYLVWSLQWSIPGGREYTLIVIAPISDFVGHLKSMQNRIITTLFILICILFPIIFLVSRSFSKFLIILAQEASEIQHFNFDGHLNGKTFIYEFYQLSQAFLLMKETISLRTKELEVSMKKLEQIIELGIAMSTEKDTDKLVETILMGAKELSLADGGSIYLKGENDVLDFKIVLNDSLSFMQGGTSSNPITLPAVPIYNEDGSPNINNVVTAAYNSGNTISIDNAYENPDYDFSGTKKFDELNNYKSISFLTVPLKIQGGAILGALQLINAASDETGKIIPFNKEIQRFIEALSTEAAAVLNNRKASLYQRQLFDSMIELIAGAIDTKNPTTGEHCARVPEIAMMLAKEAEETRKGPLADFRFKSSEERRAFRIGVWLHDCGKITTPEFVINKSVKLETIHNRIHEIRTRFEVMLRDLYLEEKNSVIDGVEASLAREKRKEKERELYEDFSFIADCNIGSEFMDEEKTERLKKIAMRKWYRSFDASLGISWEELERLKQTGGRTEPGWENILSDKPEQIIPISKEQKKIFSKYKFDIKLPDCMYNRGEMHNLSISKGTLSEEERFKINEHIIQTIIMLDKLPFSDEMSCIPHLAGTHHETLSGDGYPMKLKENELGIPERILLISDIFEALTAADRPYKKAKTLSEAIIILYELKTSGKIDPSLFDLFLTSGIYRTYGEKYLSAKQLDYVDINQFLG